MSRKPPTYEAGGHAIAPRPFLAVLGLFPTHCEETRNRPAPRDISQ
jgi:hypothetical protein